MADMIRQDLRQAREQWIKASRNDEDRQERLRSDFLSEKRHDGSVVVFYSLRHGFGTALGDAGVPDKDIAQAMHHTNPATTRRYTHTSERSRKAAIASLPTIGGVLLATGTDGSLRGGGATEPPHGATGCRSSAPQVIVRKWANPLEMRETPRNRASGRRELNPHDLAVNGF